MAKGEKKQRTGGQNEARANPQQVEVVCQILAKILARVMSEQRTAEAAR